MNRPDEPRPSRGAGLRRTRDEHGMVVPSRVMLVAIVLIAIAAATYVAGLGSGGSESDVASPASAREASSSSSAPVSGTESSPSASASAASPSASASATAKAEKADKKAGTPEKSTAKKPDARSSAAAAAPTVQRGQVNVSVFNNSSQRGLAARTSGKVKDAGWKVIGTDNWYGTIPQPTVYYPASMKAAARLLAKDVGIDRVKPAVNPMRSDRLTVIVTADYTA